MMKSNGTEGDKAGLVRRHFETFDAFRFVACLKVFLQHLPIFAFPVFNFLRAGGGIGVQFFFVLSGFLISYIIFEEKKHTGTLNLKNFFARRILRIWPLFYLMIGVAFITPFILGYLHLGVNDDGYTPTWWMSLLFLENYKMILTNSLPNVSPLAVMWSLCVEEHFYIVWGLLLFLLPMKHYPRLIGFFLVLAPVARIIFFQHDLVSSDITTNIDLFAFGAIPAWWQSRYPEKVEEWLAKIPKALQYLYPFIVLVVAMVLAQTNSERQNIWGASVLGALFSMLIVQVMAASSVVKIKDSNWFSRAGLYTYGFYLYHTLVMVLAKRIFDKLSFSVEQPGIAVVFALVCFIVTMLICVLSYRFYEKPFLRLKKYFR